MYHNFIICSLMRLILGKVVPCHLSRDMTKPTKWVCAQRRLRSAWASRTVWSESSLCAQWVAKDPSFLHADSEDWSDWAEAQADLSLRWAHSHFISFVMSRLIYCLMWIRERSWKCPWVWTSGLTEQSHFFDKIECVHFINKCIRY